MKTILLTSAGMNMRDEIVKILPKPVGQIKLAHIITASKVEEDISYVENERAAMAELGLQVEEIDIEGKDEDELRKTFADKDVIYVQGGNTFFLLKCVHESGFDRVVKELIEEGVIYIGVSAGSIIVGPTIETAGWKGTDGDQNIAGIENLSGMNLIDFNVFVHYQEKYCEAVESESQASKYPVKTLTNDQAVLVRDGRVEFIEK